MHPYLCRYFTLIRLILPLPCCCGAETNVTVYLKKQLDLETTVTNGIVRQRRSRKRFILFHIFSSSVEMIFCSVDRLLTIQKKSQIITDRLFQQFKPHTTDSVHAKSSISGYLKWKNLPRNKNKITIICWFLSIYSTNSRKIKWLQIFRFLCSLLTDSLYYLNCWNKYFFLLYPQE